MYYQTIMQCFSLAYLQYSGRLFVQAIVFVQNPCGCHHYCIKYNFCSKKQIFFFSLLGEGSREGSEVIGLCLNSYDHIRYAELMVH